MPDERRPHFTIPIAAVRSDSARVTGFGATYPRENYSAHGETLARQSREFRRARAELRDATYLDSAFVQVTTPPEIAIRSERLKLAQVGLELLTVSRTAPNRGVARIRNDRLDELEARIIQYATLPANPSKSYLSVIEAIGVADPSDKIPEEIEELGDDEIACIVLLYGGLTDRERAAIGLSLRNYFVETASEVGNPTLLSSGTTALEVTLTPDGMREAARSFSTIRTFSPNRVYYLPDSTPFYPVNPVCAVNPPSGETAVAIFDGGVNSSCNAFRGVIQAVIPSLPPGSVAPLGDHGSFVASRIVYGDELESQQTAGVLQPSCHIVDVPIFGRDASGRLVPPSEPQLAAAIEAAIARLPANARVLNLSLGTDVAIRDGTYSLVAQTLDDQARKHDLIPIVTAGNIRDERRVATFPNEVYEPYWRIDPPGESLLSVTVGSVAKYVDSGALSRAGEVSPFSRRGPGADGGVKPELVAHGGNCLSNGRPNSRVAVQGIHPTGAQVAWDVGTSFAAPLVASAAATICDNYPRPSANLVKALLFHFAERAVPTAITFDPRFLSGFGIPRVLQALAAGPSSAAFLFSGTISARKYQYLPFHVPKAFATEETTKLRIRGTLVFDPPINVNNEAEYSRARMTVLLRKAVELGFREVSLSPYMFSSTSWNPVVHFDAPFTKGFASGTWELRTRLWTRGLPDDHEQSYSVVLEVVDSSGRVDVWQRTIDESSISFNGVAETDATRSA